MIWTIMCVRGVVRAFMICNIVDQHCSTKHSMPIFTLFCLFVIVGNIIWLVLLIFLFNVHDGCHYWSRNCLPFPVFIPGFQWGSCCSILSFLCNVLYIVVCPFVLFLLAIVLSVLRFTDSNYSFGIFKLFVVHKSSTSHSICILREHLLSIIFIEQGFPEA